MLSALLAAAAPVWNAAASLDTARTNHTATLLLNGKVLVAGGGSSLKDPPENPLASAELYDPATNIWSAAGAMAIGRWLHTATLLSNGKVLVVGGANHGTVDSPIGSAELYDPATNSWSAAGALATARNWHTATLLANGKVLVAGGYGGKDNYLASAELYDPLTNSWSAAGTLPGAFGGHTATLLLNGKVLVAQGDRAQLYDPANNSWSAARAMTNWRVWHTATLLPNGKVLVAAGHDGRWDDYASTELYDPATDTWSAAGALSAARYGHTATLLSNGKVLVAGGDNYLANAELYDPASNSWSIAGALTVARESHTATLLLNGKVLFTGGYNYFYLGRALASAELYDPTATDSWRAAGALTAPRHWHTATLLPNGGVLVAGGYNAGSLASTERYNPATNSWRTAGTMSAARYGHTATLLPNGTVLVAAGDNASAELYDPATDSWRAAGALSTARSSHTATLLPNGKVLVAGGYGYGGILASNSGPLASAELYDPATNSWSPAGAMSTVRFSHAATLLPNGKVLVEGGHAGGHEGSPLASAELYDPATNRWSPAGTLTTARSGHTATLLDNGAVLVAGGGDASAELYDPVTEGWSAAGAMAAARSGHTATQLADGKVLVAGGSHRNALASAEQYDPASNSWSAAGAMTAARNGHTMTLLPSGKVLVAGGAENSSLANVDLYDPTFYLPLPCALIASPSAISGSSGSQAGCNTVMEFYNTTLDHYFITADASEASAIDNGSAGPGWSRTGLSFKAGGTTPVCRFYGSQSPGPNSHFYTVMAEECATLKQLQASTPATQKRWNFESLDFLSSVPLAAAPGSQLTCASGLAPVYRVYNNGFARGVDSNHRLSTSPSAIQQLVARGWINEGVAMCAPL